MVLAWNMSSKWSTDQIIVITSQRLSLTVLTWTRTGACRLGSTDHNSPRRAAWPRPGGWAAAGCWGSAATAAPPARSPRWSCSDCGAGPRGTGRPRRVGSPWLPFGHAMVFIWWSSSDGPGVFQWFALRVFYIKKNVAIGWYCGPIS